MAQATLMPNKSVATIGNGVFVGTQTKSINLQLVPQGNLGFSGTVLIESSSAPSPVQTDWYTIATLTFSAHTTTVAFNLYLVNNPWIRAKIPAAVSSYPIIGAISVHVGY